MRIANWNLERPQVGQGAKLEGLVEQMAVVDADVWIFTESSEVVALGVDHVGAHSKHIADYIGHTEREVRSSIWSRYPIIQEIETHDPETAVCVELDTPMGSLIVYATIIPYHNAGTKYPYRYMLGEIEGLRQWELHSQSIDTHAADWQRIREWFPDSHICVGGDFNQNRDGQRWYGTKAVREQMTKGLESTHLKCVTEEDFRANGKLTTRANIDHICLDYELADRVQYTGAWEAGKDAKGKRLSDHNGVWVDVAIDALDY